jgi:hypothetical protein
VFCHDVSCGDVVADYGEYGGAVLIDTVDRDILVGI